MQASESPLATAFPLVSVTIANAWFAECKCDSGDLPCDDGYTLRFESSSQTERDEYLDAYFSAPGSDGELHWKLPLYSSDSTPCGLPAGVGCKTEVFRDSSEGCNSARSDTKRSFDIIAGNHSFVAGLDT